MLMVICVKYLAFGKYVTTGSSIGVLLFLTKESFIMSVVVILFIFSLHTSNVNNFQCVFILLLETWKFSSSKRLIIYKSKVFFLLKWAIPLNNKM